MLLKDAQNLEDWEVLDKRYAAQLGEGTHLVWWLIADDTARGSTWHPLMVSDDQRTVVKIPDWAPLPGSQMVFLSSPIFETLYAGSRGFGKGLHSYEPVLTPKGWKAIGLLKEGDEICAPDGSITVVTDVYPQGQRPCYRVSFDDKSSVVCDDQHLWLVSIGQGAEANKRVVGMPELHVLLQASVGRPHKRVYTPVSNAVSFISEGNRPLDPYMLGLMLGDGSCTNQIRFTTMDDEIARYVVEQGFRYQGNNGSKADTYTISKKHPVAVALKSLGVWEKRSWEKSVPQVYLIADAETRLAVLQGIFDTDGCSEKKLRSFAEFSTTSEQLAKDVKFLALSLGAKVRMSSKIPMLYGKAYRRAWTVRIQPAGRFMPFRLTRKVANATEYAPFSPKRRLVSIEPVGSKDSTCIRVKHPSGLFITRDFIVTHNSEALLFDYAKEVGKGYGENWRGILFRKQLGDLDEMVRKAEMLYTKLFPGFRFLHAKSDYAAVWPSGERLLFRHLANEEEYQEYHGHQYPWIGFEELTQWENDKAYRKMFSCCRPTRQGIPTRIRANTNPFGVGRNWVKKRFQLPAKSNTIVRVPGEELRVAVLGSVYENFPMLHSDPGYPARIKASASSPGEAEAWLNGNWEVSSGGMFDDIWDKNIHVIPDIKPSAAPRGWRLSRAYDHGQSKPFALGWWGESNGEPIRIAVYDPEGVLVGHRHIGSIRGDLVLFKEWYGCKEGEDDTGVRMRATAIAQGIKDREKDWNISHRVNPGPADTEIWSKDSRGTQLAPIDDFESVLGVDCFERADKSPGSRIRGWQKIREFMEGSVPGADGTRENPGIYVCEGCLHWIELVPPMPRDPANQDEVANGCEDHMGDMCRYRCTWSHSFMAQSHF